jgi:HAE1 family hydrophobic/amphiphilic exporter-1
MLSAGFLAGVVGLSAPLALAQSNETRGNSSSSAVQPEKGDREAEKRTGTDQQASSDSSAKTTADLARAGGPAPAEPDHGGTGIVQQTDPQKQTENPITQPLALSPEVPRTRVGVNEDQKVHMTLQDAITLALQKSLDIEISRQSVQISQYSLFGAHGVYDVSSSATIGYRSTVSPTSNVFVGGSTSGSVSNKSFTYNFSSTQEVERTGGRWSAFFNNSRATTSSTTEQFVTRYSPSLTFNYTQPLLRDLSFDDARRSIQLAKKRLDLSDAAFRQRVIEIISSVQSRYWDLVFAIRNEQIARDSVELARVQLENNRKMVEAGTEAPIELRSTEAALESRKADVIVALQQITTAENALKTLIINDKDDSLWTGNIIPTDQPHEAQTTFSLDEATRLALRNRPELEQQKLSVEQNDIDIRFFKSQLKPQLDLGFTYTNFGQAGIPAPPSEFRPPVAERFDGGYLRALSNLFSQDFRTYEVGVTITFPWRNRAAEGNLGTALAEGRQLDAQYRQLVQSIQVEVRNALQAVEAARLRYQAQKANRLASEAQYKGELERFRAGLQTNFFVLQRQTELSQALGAELRALTDYNKALAELQRVTGLTLVSNNVQVPASRDPDSK